MSADVSAEALERALVEQVSCAAPLCPNPAVWVGSMHHLRRQPILCQSSQVCDEHRALVERHEREQEAATPRWRGFVCDLHGYMCERHVRWRAL